MTGHSKHDLGQLRHIDLLALAIEADAAPSDVVAMRFGSRSRDQLIAALTQTGPLRRLEARTETRLDHDLS